MSVAAAAIHSQRGLLRLSICLAYCCLAECLLALRAGRCWAVRGIWNCGEVAADQAVAVGGVSVGVGLTRFVGVRLNHLRDHRGLWPPRLTQEQEVEIKVNARRGMEYAGLRASLAVRATRSDGICATLRRRGMVREHHG